MQIEGGRPDMHVQWKGKGVDPNKYKTFNFLNAKLKTTQKVCTVAHDFKSVIVFLSSFLLIIESR